MNKDDAIAKYNKKRNARLAERVRHDWKDAWRDHGTLDEYDYVQNRAQSFVLNNPSAVRKADPKSEIEEFNKRLNSYRSRGNFGQLHMELGKIPDGAAISYDGEDWVKDGDKWNPREAKPLRTIDFAKKVMSDGKEVEYDPNGKKKASKNTESKLKKLWAEEARGPLNELLKTRPEGSVLTIDGVEYRKDGYLKWESNGDKYGSRSMTERIDKANGKFTFNC